MSRGYNRFGISVIIYCIELYIKSILSLEIVLSNKRITTIKKNKIIRFQSSIELIVNSIINVILVLQMVVK